MNYSTALNIVETFMSSSGIRSFCTIICKGYCCRDCYDSPRACRYNEGRRITCSIFICSELIELTFDKKEKNKYYRVRNEIIKLVVLSYKKSLAAGNFDIKNKNHYFQPMTREQIELFEIDKNKLNLPETENIKNKVINIISLTKKVGRNEK
jgi:hypothetical protein